MTEEKKETKKNEFEACRYSLDDLKFELTTDIRKDYKRFSMIKTYNQLVEDLRYYYDLKNEGYLIGKARSFLFALWSMNYITKDDWVKRVDILGVMYVNGIGEVLKECL